MKKQLLILATLLSVNAVSAQQASYDVPTTLSYFGTIETGDGEPFPRANHVTTNPINDGAFIWVPVGSLVMYKNTSDDGAEAYRWTAPGAIMNDERAANLIVRYDEAGTFDFPTLTTSYASGDKTFKQDLKIKVGGQAELCHSDTRQWGTTYGLGYAPYDKNGGYFGGSNNRNITGYGNIYRFPSGNLFVDGVNVYAAKQPTKFDKNAKVKIRIYMPYIGESDFSMIGIAGAYGGALELDDIPMGNYRTRDDGAYLPIKDYCVYNMTTSSPMSCENIPYIFVAVEGFSYDPSVSAVTEDFVIATDVLPGHTLTLEDYSDAMAHNTFVKQANDTDYLRPGTMFGGMSSDFMGGFKSYNLWICPLVRGSETPAAGIDDITANLSSSALTLERSGDLLTISGAKEGEIAIYTINGIKASKAYAANGGAVFNTGALAHGVYIIRAADGATAKFAK